MHLEQRELDSTHNIQLDEKRTSLENIRKEKVNDILIRSRIQCLNEGENPSSFFCKLENKNSRIQCLNEGENTEKNNTEINFKGQS